MEFLERLIMFISGCAVSATLMHLFYKRDHPIPKDIHGEDLASLRGAHIDLLAKVEQIEKKQALPAPSIRIEDRIKAVETLIQSSHDHYHHVSGELAKVLITVAGLRPVHYHKPGIPKPARSARKNVRVEQ